MTIIARHLGRVVPTVPELSQQNVLPEIQAICLVPAVSSVPPQDGTGPQRK